MEHWPRRIFTLLFWPFVDSTLTLISYFLIAKFGPILAIVGTAILGISLNFFFLYLLSLEVQIHDWIERQISKIDFLRRNVPLFEKSEIFAVLLVYLISGPAMLGAPLIWILDIKGLKRIFLVVVGITLNSIIWVGGIHNSIWTLIEKLILARHGIL